MTPSAIEASRLDPVTARQVFRRLVDAAARPGRIVTLPDAGPPILLPALALTDLDVRVAIVGPGADQLATALTAATGARRTEDLADAGVVIATAPLPVDDVARLRRGTAHRPEDGAQLYLACDGFEDGDAFVIRGPGAGQGRARSIGGVDPALIAAVQRANRPGPAGVDTWLVAPDGSLVALPRSSVVTLVDEAVA